MDGIEIRAPREEEFHAIWEISCVAFGQESTAEDEEGHRLGFPFERALCAYEDGKMLATSSVYSLELTVPGQVAIPNGGLTWISTLPTRRRQGLLRQLVAAQCAYMVERGEPVSTLLASEGGIYSRFGYGPCTSVLGFSVSRPYAALETPPGAAVTGRLKLLDADEAAIQLPVIYESLRLAQPGAVSRPSEWWRAYLADPPSEREGATTMFHVTHETAPATPDGYVSYRIKADWSGSTASNTVLVVELLAAGPGAYRELWDYLLTTDLCETISCCQGRMDEPLRWLLADPRRFKAESLSDYLWLRLLDVPRALSARAYRAAGELVFDVADEFPTPNKAQYLLRADPAFATGAECARTRGKADLALQIEYLGAAYLGGVSFATLAAAGRVRELTTGAVERADAMFSTGIAPYCSTMF
jgi:predicted acetyltransferase